MGFVTDWVDEKQATDAGAQCARNRLDPSAVVDRFLEAKHGPPLPAGPEGSLALRHASTLAQQARVGLMELEGSSAARDIRTGGNPPLPAWTLLAIFIACCALDYLGAVVTAHFAGIPMGMRGALSASFTVGALLLTSGYGVVAEWLWGKGIAGRIAAIALGAVYLAVLAVAGASRFATDDEDAVLVDIAQGAVFAVVSIGGPAVGAHLALRAWFRSRPLARQESRARREQRVYERDLRRGRAELEQAERDAQRKEERRSRMRAAFLVAYRAEAGRLAALERNDTNGKE
ncbi:MAG: hypothetical protein K8H88_13605 [Sandaracinaceae bacterium]|nr:hypothetical protein [Sandaracinaceae bacterium]